MNEKRSQINKSVEVIEREERYKVSYTYYWYE